MPLLSTNVVYTDDSGAECAAIVTRGGDNSDPLDLYVIPGKSASGLPPYPPYRAFDVPYDAQGGPSTWRTTDDMRDAQLSAMHDRAIESGMAFGG